MKVDLVGFELELITYAYPNLLVNFFNKFLKFLIILISNKFSQSLFLLRSNLNCIRLLFFFLFLFLLIKINAGISLGGLNNISVLIDFINNKIGISSK
jgi:hypothetical protein